MTITYTTSGSAVFTESLNLELYAGALVDSTRWLDGAKGASGDYPGSLNPFLPTNDDTTNTAGRGLKLVTGKLTTALVDDETITLSGGADTIHAVIVGNTSVAAAGVSLKNITNGVAQFTVVGSPDALVTLWMIVS
jgi:hypothetical protein|tara:strand:+ start:239 stop:646 length:408 start_codon:yes stop_codon:yes gene_type:complete